MDAFNQSGGRRWLILHAHVDKVRLTRDETDGRSAWIRCAGARPGKSAGISFLTQSSPPPVTTPLVKATATTASDTLHNEAVLVLQVAQTQDGNTMVPVIIVGLQSVHGHGHGLHQHAEGRDEYPPLPPRLRHRMQHNTMMSMHSRTTSLER